MRRQPPTRGVCRSCPECLPKHLGKDGVVAIVPIVVISQTDPLHGGREAWGFGVEEIQVGMLGTSTMLMETQAKSLICKSVACRQLRV